MSVDMRQNADGSVGFLGATLTATASSEGFVPVTVGYNVPAADTSFFQADRVYVVKAIRGTNDVIGTGGACTAVVRKVPSGTAITSGTALHSGSFNLVGTVNTTQALTLSTTGSDLLLAVGDRIAIDYTGTATSAIGSVTVTLAPA